ncbi:transcriptional regulator [Paenibacillus sp. CAA11]|uniref:AraC family transcriptional regulator n=1 Tax=Paenibacillus sp. CAA11 TaxID=1532905 RepID=UPI000D3D9D82|nr:AraC family transcriptional regulator [Paenibacillus sp. CAA11]AWB45476.1 transcriptional regulator [Paenibacillus sp. CAA11]
MKAQRRFVFTVAGGRQLPLLVESVGFNPDQEPIQRPDGYPVYHWIQTLEGEGVLTCDNQTCQLPVNTGVLLMPHVPHAYQAAGEKWSTLYLTLSGSNAAALLGSLGIHHSSYFEWENGIPLGELIQGMLERLDQELDVFGIETSADAYRFLLMLNRFGQKSASGLTRNIEKLAPLIEWMESHYADPDIGLAEFCSVTGLSSRYLNTLFRKSFGLSPYAYLLHLRLHKAKELLAASRQLSITSIAEQTGFREVSHFIATFRKNTGSTPEQFRRLH